MPARPADLKIIWSGSARTALLDTLQRIVDEDPVTADLLVQRMERAIALIAIQPGIGTPVAQPGVRRFAIPRTGHSIDYRVVRGELRIQRWFRQRRRVGRKI